MNKQRISISSKNIHRSLRLNNENKLKWVTQEMRIKKKKIKNIPSICNSIFQSHLPKQYLSCSIK